MKERHLKKKKKGTLKLNFIIHLVQFYSSLCVCMWLFPVYVRVQERAQVRERETKCVCVCVCQRSDVIGVSCLTLLEEAGSVERWGPPVS